MTSPPLPVVAVLLAGRAAFRGALVVSVPVLLSVWGPDTFGPYAVAVGSTLVLNPLVGSGTEKSAGTLLPRAYRRGPVLAAHLLTAAVIAGGSLLLTVPFALVDPDRAGLWLLAGATNVGFGAAQALVAYWRVLGAPLVDAAGFGLLAAATVLGMVGRLGPLDFLALQAGTAAALSVVLAVALRRRLGRPRRRTVWLVARTTVLMGSNTLLATAPFSVVMTVLSRRPVAASAVYLAITAYTVLGNVVDYLQRVYQPWLTGVLRSDPARVLAPGRRLTRLSWLVLAPAGAVAAWFAPSIGVLVGMLAIAPVLLAAALLTWVRENAATAALGRTTRAGLAGLLGTTVVAVLFVPPFGAAGALLALVAGATVHIAVLSTGNDAYDSHDTELVAAR